MAISEGDKVPSVKVKNPDMSDVTTDELFNGRKIVLFAVPHMQQSMQVTVQRTPCE